MKYIKIIPFLLLFTACVNKIEQEPDNATHPVTIATRSGDTEAGYKHSLLLFRGNGQGADIASIEVQQATSSSAIQPFSLTNGNYTLAALAFSSNAGITFSPPITNGSTLATQIKVDADREIPDMLFVNKSFAVSQAATVQMELKRIVGRVIISLSNVPASPAIKSVGLTVGKLTDCFAFDGTYSSLINPVDGVSRNISLVLKSGTTGTYTNEGTVLMPSLAGTTTLPLTLNITYIDNTVGSKTFTVAGSIRGGYTSTINLNYVQSKTPQAISFTYAPWQTDSFSADVEMGTPTNPQPPAGDIGALAHGGIICTSGLVLSLTESSSLFQWSTLSTPVTVGGTSTDGAINYSNFAVYADAGSGTTRWDKHAPYQYIKTLRTTDGSAWYLPSKEEWESIAANLTTINSALSVSGNTPITGADSYWTSTENSADFAYYIIPATKTIGYISKSQAYRVRAVKKINP